MTLQNLATAQSNAQYSKMFYGRPHRFVIPLYVDSHSDHNASIKKNLVTLSHTYGATAYLKSMYKIYLTPGRICNVGIETPTINYDVCNGKPYRYFYGISSDVDDPVSSGKLYKVHNIEMTFSFEIR